MIKLVEVVKDIGRISLRDVFVNPKHVVYLREDNMTKKYVVENRNPNFDNLGFCVILRSINRHPNFYYLGFCKTGDAKPSIFNF